MNIEKGGYSYKLVLKPRVSGSVTELKEGATNGTTEDANTSSDYEQVQ
jgi:hypothetical protein